MCCWFETKCTSVTGKLIYSDQSWFASGKIKTGKFLNAMANIPVVGIIAGVARVALAAFHMIAHVFAAAIARNTGHLAHVVKGFTELLRGVLEAIPVIGRIFSMIYNPNYCCHNSDIRDGYEYSCNFFLAKIYNPENPDDIDKAFAKMGSHPFMKA